MKSIFKQGLVLLLLPCRIVEGFAPSQSMRFFGVKECDGTKGSETSVAMGGFLDGRVPKNDIMKKEDEAMWVDDGSDKEAKSGGWNPFEIAKSFDKPKSKSSAPLKKKPSATPEPPKQTGGFKMPWGK
ncbi:hypothetical protein IV203_030114 [Nitzschia inconspicua]|uniref:Uncharacterized protein n=1 Tax=Nitzschia inconspicua TaxID=303405 RepID=A0A9K3LSZ2_9STRA|nr:hypothetical protein IV203_030114 [Nitzschia inconspicua]